MEDHTIVLPSRPKIVSEEDNKGVYEIDGFYPGYGDTIGNSLRRIILSSLPGAAITSIKIEGIDHEFTSIDNVKEDVISIMLNVKRLRIKMDTDEPQTLTIKAKGETTITAGMIEVPGQVTIMNPDLVIATLTSKQAELKMELMAEKGLGFVLREASNKNRTEIGTIALDANFTPIRRVSYESENMRVGDKTNFNRLRILLETDGSITPREALEKAIYIMIEQLKAIVGFEEKEEIREVEKVAESSDEAKDDDLNLDPDFLKTRIETLNLSARTQNALSSANIRTVGGLARKKEIDILEVEGLGAKGVAEIKRVLLDHGITLK